MLRHTLLHFLQKHSDGVYKIYIVQRCVYRKSSATDVAAKTVTIWVIFIQFAYYTFPAEMVAFEVNKHSAISTEFTSNILAVRPIEFYLSIEVVYL